MKSSCKASHHARAVSIAEQTRFKKESLQFSSTARNDYLHRQSRGAPRSRRQSGKNDKTTVPTAEIESWCICALSAPITESHTGERTNVIY